MRIVWFGSKEEGKDKSKMSLKAFLSPTLAKLPSVRACNWETLLQAWWPVVIYWHSLTYTGTGKDVAPKWSPGTSSAEVGEYIHLTERESKFLNGKWSTERTGCDNHDCRERSAHSYQSINLCMYGCFYTVILDLCSVPCLLPLTKNHTNN